jgi:hypothetical protein
MMNDKKRMRKLKVDLDELAYALEDASWETNHYLDLETGRVISIAGDTYRELEGIYEEAYDPEAEEVIDLAELVRQRDTMEWHKQVLLEANEIETNAARYLPIEAEPYEAYNDMEDFIFTVRDERLQDRLFWAIKGRGAFRRFKDVLAGYPRERERWFEYHDKLMEERVVAWLASENIEPIVEPRPTQEPPPPVRPRLIEEVVVFVRAASQLPGVIRIALIGSLATDELEPKDIDMLVTVTDKMNLNRLATLGRKLNGHVQSFGRGGEVFLANPQGDYLGRTCPWKQCGPGIRASCDARHCGRRPYLHDDWDAIQLTSALIAAPPIGLWPQAVAHVPVPGDLETGLIAVLRKG